MIMVHCCCVVFLLPQGRAGAPGSCVEERAFVHHRLLSSRWKYVQVAV